MDSGKEREEEKTGKVSEKKAFSTSLNGGYICREVRPDSKYTGRKRKPKF